MTYLLSNYFLNENAFKRASIVAIKDSSLMWYTLILSSKYEQRLIASQEQPIQKTF